MRTIIDEVLISLTLLGVLALLRAGRRAREDRLDCDDDSELIAMNVVNQDEDRRSVN